VYVFTGDGKGKTSAALGVAMRAVASGMRVAWVAWYKEASWRISEYELPDLVGNDRFQMYLLGKGFHIKIKNSKLKNQNDSANLKVSTKTIKTALVGNQGQVVLDHASEEEHRQAALAALERARELLDIVDVLVLDEVNNAVDENLLHLFDLVGLISSRKKTHLILTGRNADSRIVELADLVTEMKKTKHPYDRGKLAVKGLDF
jgi:cob(I)alamin adenosyltransferase